MFSTTYYNLLPRIHIKIMLENIIPGRIVFYSYWCAYLSKMGVICTSGLVQSIPMLFPEFGAKYAVFNFMFFSENATSL